MVRVMLVDDEPSVRCMLAAFLHVEPDIHIVAEAANGDAAIKAAEIARPDVILMDVEMPIMNGVEATRAVKERWPETVVLGFSASMGTRFEGEMLVAGASAVLDKFTPLNDLLAAIRTHCPVPDPVVG
jgi:DNA-binding NarL/FixJ family response regulator